MPRNNSNNLGHLANRLFYLWKSYDWLLRPPFFLTDTRGIPIDRPIFLLGVQGGGLTLLSRMLRRHPAVVSVTGNSRYWAGADEMQNVFGLILPAELSGMRYKAPPHPLLTPPRSWTYACDELLPYYRRTAKDMKDDMAERFKRIIAYSIRRFSSVGEGEVRFTDKSQVFTVKLSLLNKLLEGCSPKFVLVTRNPYISCYRAAIGKAGDMARLRRKLSHYERLTLCSQHWRNSYASALEDSEKEGIPMLIVRFEDLIRQPKEVLSRICQYAELSFFEDMIPQEHHRLPFGSVRTDRWYPIRNDVDQEYQRRITEEDREIIDRHCRPLAERFGYQSTPSARPLSRSEGKLQENERIPSSPPEIHARSTMGLPTHQGMIPSGTIAEKEESRHAGRNRAL